MPKTRINLSLDQDLADFAKIFAAENRTSFSEIVTQYLLSLKRHHPAFQDALEKAQTKLQNGTARWHSYHEVFGE